MAEKAPGRNALCWCGSGKKYKKCHLQADSEAEAARNRPSVPRAREYFEVMRNILPLPQVRSEDVGPEGH